MAIESSDVCSECPLGPCAAVVARDCQVLAAWQGVRKNRDAGEGQARPGSESREDPPGVRAPEGPSGGRSVAPNHEHAVTRIVLCDSLPLADEWPLLDLSGADKILVELAEWLGGEHARVFSECRAQLHSACTGSGGAIPLSLAAREEFARRYLRAFVARDTNASRRRTVDFASYWLSDFVTFNEKEGRT